MAKHATVSEWLLARNMESLASTFADQGIDRPKQLKQLTPADLAEMNVPIGWRPVILDEIGYGSGPTLFGTIAMGLGGSLLALGFGAGGVIIFIGARSALHEAVGAIFLLAAVASIMGTAIFVRLGSSR